MSTLSVCLIVKNEEQVLDRCLKCVQKFADEIVVVDTGSTDNTIKIANKYTDKIFKFNWCDDFSKARNYSFEKASCDYLMWIDADDIISIKNIKKINQLKLNMSADTYMLKYETTFVNNKAEFVYYRERIVKKCRLANWYCCVHECIAPFGKIEYVDISIFHKKIEYKNPKRNLKIFEKTKKQRDLNPREQYYYARELFDNKKFKQSIVEFKKFINSKLGWIENIIDSYYMIGLNYIYLKNFNKALYFLMQSFNYSNPRPNITCAIADCYFNLDKIYLAIFWYKLSLDNKLMSENYTFMLKLYKNYYPAIQLCVCYYKLGNIDKSIYYNKLAEKYNPNSIAVQNNNKFFDNLNQKNT